MPLRISLAPYRLLFKRPFGTSHGVRDGTDAVFVRLEQQGVVGYGEVTLPPYVKETSKGSVERIQHIAAQRTWTAQELIEHLDKLDELKQAPGCRAGLQMALMDWTGKNRHTPVFQMLDISAHKPESVLMTVDICPIDELAVRVAELPDTGSLKLKVGDAAAKERVNWVLRATGARILLDGNQGLGTVQEAVDLAHLVGADRLIGFEQPFPPGAEALGRDLADRTGARVIADESLQEAEDLPHVAESFGGVNIKLMKCGGLDAAQRIAGEARRRGLGVMLGSMSESSLGCTAMAHLAGAAEIADLDGPWLLKNDPFKGIGLADRALVVPERPGLGAELVADLDWIGT